jgi:stage II sporulation protein AA (anti-sigma F factor antagonist)
MIAHGGICSAMASIDSTQEAVGLLKSYEKKGDILIVELEGELDHHFAGKARESLDRLLDDTSIRHLILHLKRLNFMDSSGIGVFIGRYKIIKNRGGEVCVTNMKPHVNKILELSGLYKILNPYDTVSQAVDGIRREVI